MSNEEKSNDRMDELRKLTGMAFIWIANILNTFLAFGISFLLLALSALNDSDSSILVFVIIVMIFCIVVIFWFSLYRLLFKGNTRWKIVIAIIGILNTVGGIFEYSQLSRSIVNASNIEVLMNWQVWIFIAPAVLYFAALVTIKKRKS